MCICRLWYRSYITRGERVTPVFGIDARARNVVHAHLQHNTQLRQVRASIGKEILCVFVFVRNVYCLQANVTTYDTHQRTNENTTRSRERESVQHISPPSANRNPRSASLQGANLPPVCSTRVCRAVGGFSDVKVSVRCSLSHRHQFPLGLWCWDCLTTVVCFMYC